ncbi:hypothetical protein DL96DRAFT_1701905 [Flagelloscypha sp. PMI_526]|nr:hypothetical protein DL96DRAFT_1701905 [Flagelloscypha sp. PMI_526]
MLRRRRSQNNVPSTTPPPTAPPLPPAVSTDSTSHRIRLVPHLDSRRNLKFDPITRTLKLSDPPLKIGRFTDRSGLGLAVNALNGNKLAFKSKVVSRNHAEISIEAIPQTKVAVVSSFSGKFELRDGDLLQLGVDYQGGTEDVYKSVKIRVEVGKGREWQAGRNAFNTNVVKNLKSLAGGVTGGDGKEDALVEGEPAKKKMKKGLFSIQIRQCLFIAPCSHTFHYKCIRPLLEQHHPSFSCPLCRTYADLEEDVEVDLDLDDSDMGDVDVDAKGDDAPSPLPAEDEEEEAGVVIRPPVPVDAGVDDFGMLAAAIAANGGGGTLININPANLPFGGRRPEDGNGSGRDERDQTQMVVD